ncbi:MAG TPA: thioredoxin domain-containing protein [Segeticoccus sp.]|uniref:DsbA family protein n=1 Tax=Segeticoccus sp. TaxID=2706531 RepID=UPI002D7E5194|nr:thioredoxin domain-containing protein [Segeticoccus sp.]HET8599360.1 thioredoxin domain-containing protein [Segeticoccus sp.]
MPRPDASAKLKAARPKEGPSKVIIGAVVVVVIIIAAVVAVIVNNQSSNGASGGGSLPAHALPNGGGVVVPGGKLQAGAPTVDLWEDFQCPFCKHLEDAAGQRFNTLADQGKIKLVVHPLSFLDSNLGNDSSKRAANASLCASDAGKFEAYHSTVFAHQPTQEGAGYTDQQLLQFGKDAGISGQAYSTFEKCVNNQTYSKYVQAVQVAGDKAGIRSTPTVKVDGHELSTQQLNTILSQPQQLDQVLEAAAKK